MLKIVAYGLGTGLGYLLATYLPENPATPYIPLLLSYHFFLFSLLIKAAVGSEQKIGLSVPLPMILISHCACVAALVGMVVCRHQVPAFGLLQYAIPSLAPFEVKWLFEGQKTRRNEEAQPDPANRPEYSIEEYNEFLDYLKRGERKFQTTGRSVRDEFAAWLKHHRKTHHVVAPAENEPASAAPAQAEPELTQPA